MFTSAMHESIINNRRRIKINHPACRSACQRIQSSWYSSNCSN